MDYRILYIRAVFLKKRMLNLKSWWYSCDDEFVTQSSLLEADNTELCVNKIDHTKYYVVTIKHVF